jgi:hypothetical protein
MRRLLLQPYTTINSEHAHGNRAVVMGYPPCPYLFFIFVQLMNGYFFQRQFPLFLFHGLFFLVMNKKVCRFFKKR